MKFTADQVVQTDSVTATYRGKQMEFDLAPMDLESVLSLRERMTERLADLGEDVTASAASTVLYRMSVETLKNGLDATLTDETAMWLLNGTGGRTGALIRAVAEHCGVADLLQTNPTSEEAELPN